MQPGDAVACGPTAAVKTGNTLPLSSIPLGTAIHNVELLPGKGGQMARSAGTSCTLISRGYSLTPLPPLSPIYTLNKARQPLAPT
jgi:large subunit ribosomal protein L2